MTGFSPQEWCEHANERPNVCPCPADCVCRTRMCCPDYSGPAICSRWLSDDLLAEARLDGDRAIVGVHSLSQGIESERVCAIVESNGFRVILGEEEMCRKAIGSGLGAFLKEVGSLMPAAVVMLT